MVTIQAYELFYSRVEAPYSLRNTSGYQVVYHSSALDKSDVKEIEDQMRCFESTQVPARYQYFHLTSGAVALAISQQIDSVDTRITDRAGRPGPFVSHCLVLRRDDFGLLGNNPFLLFDGEATFVTDVETMIETQQRQPVERVIEINDIPEPTIDYHAIDVSGWNKSSFLHLWDIAADAKEIVASRRSVAVQTQDEGAIDALLRLWFIHLNPDFRLSCTFNTFVDGCEPPSGTYWMLGSVRRAKQSNAIRVHLDRCTVDYEAPHPSQAVREMAEKLFMLMREAQGIGE